MAKDEAHGDRVFDEIPMFELEHKHREVNLPALAAAMRYVTPTITREPAPEHQVEATD